MFDPFVKLMKKLIINVIHLLLIIIFINDQDVLASNPLETLKNPVGLVHGNLTLTWTYRSKESPSVANILVSLSGSQYYKIWLVEFSKDATSVKKIDQNEIPSIQLFNNITTMEVKSAGNEKDDMKIFIFNLHIKSVPANIADYEFDCSVRVGLWSVFNKKTSVKLPEPPVVNFTVTNDGRLVSKGHHVEMFCQAEGFPIPHVYLKREIDSRFITVDTSPRNLSFSILSVKPSDKGRYVCIAINMVGNKSKEINLSVKYLDSILPANQKLLAKRGGNVSLKCNIEGYPEPSYSWYSGTKKLHGNDKILTVEFKDGAQFDIYKCKAENSAGVREAVFQIEEMYLDSVVPADQKLYVKRGGKVNLECNIDGYPEPSYSWYSGTKKLHGNDKILTVEFKDGAQFDGYKCKAENSAGVREAVFQIEEMYIRVNDYDINIKATIGDTKVLKCPIVGNPEVSYSWFKSARKISDQKTLKLVLSNDKDFGEYTCSGKSIAGTQKSRFLLLKTVEKEEENNSKGQKSSENKNSDPKGRVGSGATTVTTAGSIFILLELTYLLYAHLMCPLIL